MQAKACMCAHAYAYPQDKTLWAGKLVVPHGFVHEQEEKAGQKGQWDEDQTCDLGINKHMCIKTHKHIYIYTISATASAVIKG